MEPVVEALDGQQAELRTLVADLDRTHLEAPSACPGWSVADVLLHLAQTNELAVASLDGELEAFVADQASGLAPGGDVDHYAGALVDEQRASATGARDRWMRSADAQLARFAQADLHARVMWVAGEMAARSLAATRVSETWIHTGDIAAPLGLELAPTDRLWHVARLVWRTVPYALGRAGVDQAGPVAFELVGPDGSTWTFGDDGDPATVVRGSAVELCTVAGQRASAADTSLTAEGPDGAAVLTWMRTFA